MFPGLLAELKVKEDHSSIYNHTLARILVSYASAVSYGGNFQKIISGLDNRLMSIKIYSHAICYVKQLSFLKCRDQHLSASSLSNLNNVRYSLFFFFFLICMQDSVLGYARPAHSSKKKKIGAYHYKIGFLCGSQIFFYR